MATTAEILAAIQPFLIESNKVNPTTPLYTSYGTGAVYIYRIPGTNPQALVFQSSGAIDCDGVSTSQCNATTDPGFTPDTAFHTSTDQPLDAAALPFYVLPTAGAYFNYTQNNIQGGQLGVVMYGSSINAAVFGDENADSSVIGEISYALASSLGIDPNPGTGGIETGVTYIIFTGPSSVVSPIEDHNAAVTKGNAAINTMLSQISGGGGCSPPCPQGYTCQGTTCVPVGGGGCSPPCPQGYTCQGTTCVPVGGGGCSPPCPQGYTCQGTTCVPAGGGGGGACLTDQFNILGKCVPKTTVYVGLAGAAALAWIIALTRKN